MPARDLSPAAWTAPGVARVSLGLVLSAMNNERQALDDFLSVYSPSSRQTVNLTTANNGPPPTGSNAFAIPDTTNARFLLVEMPFANTSTCMLQWDSGDVGHYIHPNGFFFTTLDPNHMPTTLYFTVGANISGVTISVF